jgi:hypothetical protein
VDDSTTGGAPTPDAVPLPDSTPPDPASAPDATPAAPVSAATGHGTIRCDQCGEEVPDLAWCVRCGDPLAAEQRRGRAGRVRDTYAASSEERASSVRLVSTLYPSLPREEIRTFQIALLGGTILVAVLGLLGFFPMAIVAAAVLVPLVTIIYVYDVDVYEDEPIRVIAFTFVWGAVAGALFSYAIGQLFPVTAASLVDSLGLGGSPAPFPWVRGVVAPIVSVVIMIAGPLVLLPYKRFNDVLDGATFGVASGVAFMGAQTLITAVNLFASGLRPVGDIVPWVIRLLVLGVGMPVIAAGAIGGLAGVLWLRYRAPVRDRARLGALGQPVVAFVVAAGALLTASLAELSLPEVGSLIVVGVLAVASLLWLRRVIHVGLLQEASEIAIGPEISCPECHKPTPLHTYCGNCGTCLKALPKAHRGVTPAVAVGDLNAPYRVAPSLPADLGTGPGQGAAVAVLAGSSSPAAVVPPQHGWLGQRSLLALFAIVMLGAVLIAAAIAFASGGDRDNPVCPDRSLPCAGVVSLVLDRDGAEDPGTGQIPAGHPFADRVPYTDASTGFSLEYDPTIWSIARQGDGLLVLTALGGNVALIFEAGTADQVEPQRLFEVRRDAMAGMLLGYASDEEPARRLLGDPILGYRDGVAGLFGGVADTSQGPTIDFSVATVTATDGRITAAATVMTPVELTIQSGGEDVTIPIREAGLSLADSVVNSFIWPADEVPQ